jgi:hypothetical protein
MEVGFLITGRCGWLYLCYYKHYCNGLGFSGISCLDSVQGMRQASGVGARVPQAGEPSTLGCPPEANLII